MSNRLRIEILHQRDPDGECEIRIWVDGEELPTGRPVTAWVETLDPSASEHTAEDWREMRADALMTPDLSPSFRTALELAYDNWADSKYVEDVDESPYQWEELGGVIHPAE